MVPEGNGDGSDQTVVDKINKIIGTQDVTRRAIYDEITIPWEVRKGLLLMCGLDGLDGLDAPEKQTTESLLADQLVEPGDLNRFNPQVDLDTLLQKELDNDQKTVLSAFCEVYEELRGKQDKKEIFKALASLRVTPASRGAGPVLKDVLAQGLCLAGIINLDKDAAATIMRFISSDQIFNKANVLRGKKEKLSADDQNVLMETYHEVSVEDNLLEGIIEHFSDMSSATNNQIPQDVKGVLERKIGDIPASDRSKKLKHFLKLGLYSKIEKAVKDEKIEGKLETIIAEIAYTYDYGVDHTRRKMSFKDAEVDNVLEALKVGDVLPKWIDAQLIREQVKKRVEAEDGVSPEGAIPRHFKRQFLKDPEGTVESLIKTEVQKQGMIGLMDLVIENEGVKGYLGEDPIKKLEELMDFSDVEKAVILPGVAKILSGDLWKLKDINTDNWDACKNNDQVKELMGRSLKGQFFQLIAKLPIPLFQNIALDFCKGLVHKEITKVKETLGVNKRVMPQASGSVESGNISGQRREASVSR